MQMGEFPCLVEITATSPGLSAYAVAPGGYQARLTIGDWSQARDFEIRIDPRLDGLSADPEGEYAELDALSQSLYDAVNEMARGITELRQVKQQLEFVLEVSSAPDVTEGGEALNATVDGWIEKLLQKELKTFQNAYQQEARLMMKYKDLLGRMGGANIPVTEGVKEVTGDYLIIWSDIEEELQTIMNQDIPAYNQILRGAGLPEIYLPRPIT